MSGWVCTFCTYVNKDLTLEECSLCESERKAPAETGDVAEPSSFSVVQVQPQSSHDIPSLRLDISFSRSLLSMTSADEAPDNSDKNQVLAQATSVVSDIFF